MITRFVNAVRAEYERLVRGKQDSPLRRLHPELAMREHVASSMAGTASAELDSFADYAKVYESYVWVRRAVGLIARALSSLPVRVLDAEGNHLEDHPLSRLLAFANDSYDASTLWELWVVHMMLAGEAFLEVVDGAGGQPVQVWARRPDRVVIIPDASRPLYPLPLSYRIQVDDRVMEVDRPHMVHFRFHHPLNPWRGLAPIAAVRQGVIIDIFAQAWAKLFLQRGARPDYAVIARQGITRSEREELEMRFLAKYGGPSGWHRPVVLEEGVTDIKPISHPPRDVEWLDQRRFSRDEVGSIFGVPDEIMGFGRDTYENFETAYRVFWLLTVLPLVRFRDSMLQRHFSMVQPVLRPGERVVTDVSGVSVLQEDLLPKVEIAERLWKMGVPLNVLDERLGLGLGPVPGGNVAYVPASMLAVDQLSGDEAPFDVRAWLEEARDQWADDDLVRRLKRALQAHQDVVVPALRSGQQPDWRLADQVFLEHLSANGRGEAVLAEVHAALRDVQEWSEAAKRYGELKARADELAREGGALWSQYP